MYYRLLLFLLFAIFSRSFAHGDKKSTSYRFIENKGQWNERVKFKAEFKDVSIFFKSNAFHYQALSIPNFHGGNVPEDTMVRGHVFEAEFVGANHVEELIPNHQSSSYNNYFIGNDRSKWKGRVHSYQEIQYKNLYSGIDLKVYQQDDAIKYDYLVQPGVSPNQIKVRYNGVDAPEIVGKKLIVQHTLGKLIENEPYAYQIINGKAIKVDCNFQINEDGTVGFDFPLGYDSNHELIVDPKLVFSSYSGSISDNWGMSGTYDSKGNGYSGGLVFGNNYVQTLGAFQTTFASFGVSNGVDIGIIKYSSNGSSLLYATFLGGNGNESVHSMVVDARDNLYLFGSTNSTNFPLGLIPYDATKEASSSTTNTEIMRFSGGADIFVSRIGVNGDTLLGSTYYGGTGLDGINFDNSSPNFLGLNYNYGDSHRGEIVLDSAGNCYIGTSTTTASLPGVIGSLSGSQDGLILKFDSSLSNLIWGRYLGGTNRDAIYSLKVINSNKVLVGGGTMSFSDFPTTPNSYSSAPFGGRSDGFISIISPNGNTIEKSTFIGTSNYDQVYFIEFDRFNRIYGYGQSGGGSFPVKNSPTANLGAAQFIIKLDENLDSSIISTTFGNGLGSGTINISPTAFLVDRCQNIYASGWGGDIITGVEGNKDLPSTMPLANNLPQFGTTDGNDFYLYVINRTSDSLLYASFFGGTSSNDHVDGGTSRFDKNGIIYQSVCASCGGNSSDFPTTANAHSTTNNSSNCNNALFKLDFEIVIKAAFNLSETEICLPPGGIDSVVVVNTSVGSTNTTWDFYGTSVITSFSDTTIYFTQPGEYIIRQTVFDSICAIGDFLNLKVTVRPDDINLSTTFDTLVCYSDTSTITISSNGKANDFIVSRSPNLSNPINTIRTDSTIKVKLNKGLNKFYIQAGNTISNSCERKDSIAITYNPTSASATISVDSVCENTPIQLNAIIQNVDTFIWKLGNGNQITGDLNPQINYPTSGNYQLQFEYENFACQQKDTLTLAVSVIDNDLTFTAPDDTLFCGTGVFNVSVNSSGSIQDYHYSSNRNFSDMLNANSQTNSINISQNDSSLYYVKINNNFCEEIDSILIEYIEYDVQLEPIIDTVCTPYTVQVNTTVIGVDSFRINGSNGFSTNTNSSPQITFNTEGIFDVELIGSNARCSFNSLVSETIHVFQSVALAPIMDTLICLGESVQLVGNSFGVANAFVWADNSSFTNPLPTISDSILNITPLQTTSYFFKATNVVCESEDTVIVNIEELDIEVDDYRSICIFDTIQMEAMINIASSPLSFVWIPNDSILRGQNTGLVEVAPRNDFFFYLETTSQTGCEDRDTIEVEVNLPAFSDAIILGIDSLYKGQETQLSTNRNGSNLIYKWEPPEGIDNVNSPNPNVTLDSSKEYKVTITDLNTNCDVIARRRIYVFEVNCADPDIFVPTAFTPNGDQSNDVLYVRGANLREIEFQLFNRWGELVFETKEINKGWNGTYQGKIVDPGVFVYQLKAICFDGQEYIDKGNITLIR